MGYPNHGLSKKAELAVHRQVEEAMTKRPLWLVTVKFKNSDWAVYKDDKRISAYFTKGRDALDHAIAQGWQAVYRGLTYNEGGYLNGVKADTSHFEADGGR